MKQHTYIAIDLKSFYASVECRDRGLDPLDTNLVVADESRTDKTICLAVTPTLKSFGISGRARLFEVKQKSPGSQCRPKAKSEGQRVCLVLLIFIRNYQKILLWSWILSLHLRVWPITWNTAPGFMRFI